MELRFLSLGRRRECYHAKDARADPLNDALDHAAFAGSISSFENDHNASVRRLDPVLEFDKLNLQLENLGLVFFVADLLAAVGTGVSTIAVKS
jgi:hypothetical protein